MSIETAAPARPHITVEMVKECALAICKKYGWPDHSADDIASQYRHPMDGFELCKELDKWCSWDTSREDMDALDELDSLVDDAINKAEREWFEKNQIEPPLPLGSTVVIRGTRGVIDGIYKHGAGKYLFKPEGQDDEEAHHARWIVNFEDAKLAEGGDA